MGSLVSNKCYMTSVEAIDAYYSAKEPSYTPGATSYLSYFEKPASTWLIVRKSIASNGTITNLTSSNAPLPTFPACDPSASFLDGVSIGWGIAAAMLLAWSVSVMKKAL